jgi:hypoxanthine phosphoribosyltransferase
MGSSEDTKDGGAEKLVLSWKEFGDLAGKLADRVAELDKGKFDLVVAMARGGIPLAMFVADKLQIAVDFMRVKSYKSLSNKTEPKLIFDVHTNIKGMKILVVDDLADTGDTLAFAVKHLKEKCEAGEIITAAMFLKPRSAFTPDLYVRAIDTWVVFPWELGESGLLDLQKQQIENNKLTVYIANPLGFSHAGKHYLNTVLLPALSVWVST